MNHRRFGYLICIAMCLSVTASIGYAGDEKVPTFVGLFDGVKYIENGTNATVGGYRMTPPVNDGQYEQSREKKEETNDAELPWG